jgi:hypothetical protein
MDRYEYPHFLPGAFMTTKYGPVSIHQNGKPVKEVAATPTPIESDSTRVAHALENLRLSMHIERFESLERLADEVKCIMRLPEYGWELKHNATCEMRIGQTHGAAVVQAKRIPLDFDDGHDTQMEVEYFLGEESLAKILVPITFPQAVSSLRDESGNLSAEHDSGSKIENG